MVKVVVAMMMTMVMLVMLMMTAITYDGGGCSDDTVSYTHLTLPTKRIV